MHGQGKRRVKKACWKRDGQRVSAGKTLRDLIPETLGGIEEMDMLLRAIDGSTDTELREKVMGMFPKREWKGAGSDAKRDIVQ